MMTLHTRATYAGGTPMGENYQRRAHIAPTFLLTS